MLVYKDGAYLFLVSRIQGEPQRHSAPLAFGDGSDAVGVFLPGSEPDHAAALWPHLGLKKQENIETCIIQLTQLTSYEGNTANRANSLQGFCFVCRTG